VAPQRQDLIDLVLGLGDVFQQRDHGRERRRHIHEQGFDGIPIRVAGSVALLLERSARVIVGKATSRGSVVTLVIVKPSGRRVPEVAGLPASPIAAKIGSGSAGIVPATAMAGNAAMAGKLATPATTARRDAVIVIGFAPEGRVKRTGQGRKTANGFCTVDSAICAVIAVRVASPGASREMARCALRRVTSISSKMTMTAFEEGSTMKEYLNDLLPVITAVGVCATAYYVARLCNLFARIDTHIQELVSHANDISGTGIEIRDWTHAMAAEITKDGRAEFGR
jgi:hypothetical protein